MPALPAGTNQQQQQQKKKKQQQPVPPMTQLLRGGQAIQYLMPTVADLRLLLETEGVAGLRVLMEPSSFRDMQPEVRAVQRSAVTAGRVSLRVCWQPPQGKLWPVVHA